MVVLEEELANFDLNAKYMIELKAIKKKLWQAGGFKKYQSFC